MIDAVVDASIRRSDRQNTLADIVRDTGLSRATAHAIVSELIDLGWLHRNDRGGITLGGSLLATASRALESDRLAAAARPVLADLVASLGIPAFLARRIDDSTITVVEYAAPRPRGDHQAQAFAVGRRIGLRPPICREFLAWEPDDTQVRWVERAPAGERARLRQALTAVAERGFSIERINDEHRAVIDALTTMSSVPESLRQRVGALVSELSAVDYLPDELTGEVGAVTVGAPVVEDGRVIAAVVACPNATMPADDLRDIGSAAVEAAGLLTSTAF
ncbi:putative IclR family transcriptional regulator [Gordonia araii NBRC 100433]|uniref:Putative IclR family transcriptional regulator n=1 Tax=Gordonia araii NBRC 100433 TaxID=1073574 RepID=G7H352_9ACTN|nr:helix-turn-helix domain-containing protein [Gordonia araii]GAB10277.1 putative IclR family transcriptional regulator [Gordonia araii NBRC 100433]